MQPGAGAPPDSRGRGSGREPGAASLPPAASGAGSVSGIVYNAITGIEAALLDLTGKALNVPVWQLLGGKFRDEVRLYADCHAGIGLESYGPALNPREPEWYREALGRMEVTESLEPAAYAQRAREGMSAVEIADVESYEGNAQGFRILTRLQMPDNIGGLQLTFATLGA